MEPRNVTCPSCGAPHEVHNPGVIMIVCEFCGNAVYWDKTEAKNLGMQSILREGFTRLFRGATGSIFNKRFTVLGRVRYSFGRGFWDEWYVEPYDGNAGWLTEDNHELCIEKPAPGVAVPPFSSVRPGSRITVGKTPFVVEEVGEAQCLGVEGDLPIVIQASERYPYADASSPDGRYSLGIEYDEEPPTVFRGQWIRYASLQLDDEGKDW